MAKATASIIARKRWWVKPLLWMLKPLVYARIVKEKSFGPLSDFIARYGFKYEVK